MLVGFHHHAVAASCSHTPAEKVCQKKWKTPRGVAKIPVAGIFPFTRNEGERLTPDLAGKLPPTYAYVWRCGHCAYKSKQRGTEPEIDEVRSE